MKANELRLGNFIESVIPIRGSWAEKQRYKGETYRVKPCTFKMEKLDNFRGITLTEKWLLDFGFERFGGITSVVTYHKDGFKWSASEGGIFLIPNNFMVYIKYVHQLQNIHFALTGQELVYKS